MPDIASVRNVAYDRIVLAPVVAAITIFRRFRRLVPEGPEPGRHARRTTPGKHQSPIY